MMLSYGIIHERQTTQHLLFMFILGLPAIVVLRIIGTTWCNRLSGIYCDLPLIIGRGEDSQSPIMQGEI